MLIICLQHRLQRLRIGQPVIRADDDIRSVSVVLGLGDADGGIEVVIGQSRVENRVAVGPETGRPLTALRICSHNLRALASLKVWPHGSRYPTSRSH